LRRVTSSALYQVPNSERASNHHARTNLVDTVALSKELSKERETQDNEITFSCLASTLLFINKATRVAYILSFILNTVYILYIDYRGVCNQHSPQLSMQSLLLASKVL
jgi:hypothetical protein